MRLIGTSEAARGSGDAAGVQQSSPQGTQVLATLNALAVHELACDWRMQDGEFRAYAKGKAIRGHETRGEMHERVRD